MIARNPQKPNVKLHSHTVGVNNMGSSDLSFAIIGAGPSGGILAAHLAKAGQEVLLVDILKRHIEVVRRAGLTISGLREFNVKLDIDKLHCATQELEEHSPDIIIVSTKACVLPRVIEDIKCIHKPGQIIVAHQNGLDNELLIAKTFGKEHVLRTVINYAGNFVENGHLRMNFFNPPNYIGAMIEDNISLAKDIAEVWTAADLATEYTPNIEHYTWEKSILNAGMSALCAITGMTMRNALDFTPTEHIVEELLKECIAVAKVCGQDYGTEFFDFCMGYLNKAGHHKTSMLADIENKADTEIDFLNGRIVEYGTEKGIAVPYNRIITGLIKALEVENLREKSS